MREVYWKIFNNIYLGAQDSLVSHYPELKDTTTKSTPPSNEKRELEFRDELNLFI